MPDSWSRELISFDDIDSLEAIRKQVRIELLQAERAFAELRKVLADDRDALIQLATLSASAHVLHEVLVLALDARTAELRTGPD